MNIIVAPHGGSGFLFRPDSTMIRALEEYYIPDFVEGLAICPFVCFKTHKAGKTVAKRFVQRFIGDWTLGVFLYPTLKGQDRFNPVTIMMQQCLDYTTIIPNSFRGLEDYPPAPVEITCGGYPLKSIPEFPSLEQIHERISAISALTSIRTGDFFAFELCPPIAVEAGKRYACPDVFNLVIK